MKGVQTNHLEKNYAIKVKNVCKSYQDQKILENVSMHAEVGTIYGLLGSSGSGKTTLLNCIVNLRRIDSGYIQVLGKNVGGKRNELDARSFGYMPQDLALFKRLTVWEMMKYFGTLYGMADDECKKRMKFLESLLNLSGSKSRIIGSLSGGQQRRVSVSLALFHEPSLVILDEPTVGLDPLLRESLWIYLRNLSATKKTTILITTHYIEEVKRAHKVGILRMGRLLIEEDPSILMETHQTVLLQEVVLKICVDDAEKQKYLQSDDDVLGIGKKRLNNNNLSICTTHWSNLGEYDVEMAKTTMNYTDKWISKKEHLRPQENVIKTSKIPCNEILQCLKRALAYSKLNIVNFLRLPLFLLVVVLLPAIQVLITGNIVGVEPILTPIGLVNHELINWETDCFREENTTGVTSPKPVCNLEVISCQFIKQIQEGNFITLKQFHSTQEAQNALTNGDIKGHILIPANFTNNLIDRSLAFKYATDETINGTIIHFNYDMTDFVTMAFVSRRIFSAFGSLIEEISEACDFYFPLMSIPFHYRHPVYGSMDVSAQDYILAALVAGFVFSISFGWVPLVVISEMKNGTTERAQLAGLHFAEMIGGLFLNMIVLCLLQGLACYIAIKFGIGFKIQGSLALYLIIFAAAAVFGGAVGLFFGAIIKDEISVILLAMFLAVALMVHTGALVPEELIALPFRIIKHYLVPVAPIIRSFRFVINRGVGLDHFEVWSGILITVWWMALFFVLAFIVTKKVKPK